MQWKCSLLKCYRVNKKTKRKKNEWKRKNEQKNVKARTCCSNVTGKHFFDYIFKSSSSSPWFFHTGCVVETMTVGFMLFYNRQIGKWICDSVNLAAVEAEEKGKPLTDSATETTNHPCKVPSEGPYDNTFDINFVSLKSFIVRHWLYCLFNSFFLIFCIL